MQVQEQLVYLFHVAGAAVLGGLIGLEREVAEKPAGFRTHMIIGGAAALMVSLGTIMVHQYEDDPLLSRLAFDPVRVVEAVVVGISFIGAGTILKDKEASYVKYLTTAATILFSAGVGICMALRQYVLAVGVTVLVLIINFVIRRVDESIHDETDRKF